MWRWGETSILEGSTVETKARDGKTLGYLKSLEMTSVTGGNDQGEKEVLWDDVEDKADYLSIYPPIYLSIEMNFWQNEEFHLKATHTGP